MELVLVKVKTRTNQAVKVQEVLTRHGCNISLRLGLHEVADDQCAEDGLIILQIKPVAGAAQSIASDLESLGGIEIKTVSL